MKNTAVIIGATGGIGNAFVKQLAIRKHNLVLVDINNIKLQKLAAAIENEYRVNVEIIAANLANAHSIQELAANLAMRKRIDLLIHAAGYGEKTFFQHELITKSLSMISVHVLSAVQLIHAVLPRMLKRKKGGIIVLSSLAAFIPAPGSSIYSATKSFLNTFLESLHMEVHKNGVLVQSLCPGLTHTGFHTAEDVKKFEGIPGLNLWMEADEVVLTSLQNMGDGVICIPGFMNKSIKNTAKLMPRKSYYNLAEKLCQKV
jgi:short-subunit dehydrogenase